MRMSFGFLSPAAYPATVQQANKQTNNNTLVFMPVQVLISKIQFHYAIHRTEMRVQSSNRRECFTSTSFCPCSTVS